MNHDNAGDNMKRSNWTKQMTILLAAICLLLVTLNGGVSARQRNSYLLQVEGVPVSREIYSYFVSEAISDGTVALDKNGRPVHMRQLRDEAARRCAELVAVSTELHRRGQSLSQQRKAEVAERSAFVWRTFGTYYRSIGVDKPTIHTIWQGRAALGQLFFSIYDDEESPRRVPDEAAQAYFYGNFAAVEALRVHLTVALDDGGERPMTIAERTSLRAQLDLFVQAANEEDAVFALVAAEEAYAPALGYMTPMEMVLQKGMGDVPDEAFDKLREWKPGTVSLLLAEDGQDVYYLIGAGINMREAPEMYYALYRGDCLWKLRGVEYASLLGELFAHYHADENVTEVERLLNGWKWTPPAAEQSAESAVPQSPETTAELTTTVATTTTIESTAGEGETTTAGR